MQLSFVLMPLLSVAYSYDSESPEVDHAMSDAPLECLITNTTTGIVTMEVCGNPQTKTAFFPKPQPACMIVQTRNGKTVHACTVLHPVAAADCDPRACLEQKKAFFSSCCCLSTACNEKMKPRPQQ